MKMTMMMHIVEMLTTRLYFTVVVVAEGDCCAEEHAISYGIYEGFTSGSSNQNADSIRSDCLIDAGDCCAYSINAGNCLKVE